MITVRQVDGTVGGAERLFEALTRSFANLGHRAEEVSLPGDESSFDQIKRNYLACYDLDVARFDMVLSTKAPTWLVRHPRHVCYLVHTIRVFYDMFEDTFARPSQELLAQRDLIHRLDTGALRPPRCRAIFTIGEEVSQRLRTCNGLASTVLHPPLWKDGFQAGRCGDYLLLPGRLHPWKRVDLVIRAMQYVRRDVKLLIVGTGESEATLRELAGTDGRIRFLGRVDDDALRGLYAEALAVPFTPKREDYGYVTLEAFASGKPVVTCSDSGEAAALVRNGVNGYVVEPEPADIGRAIDMLAADRPRAIEMGASGREWVGALSWENVARKLIEASEKSST